jgi:YHS domain-containing protein
MNPKENAPSGKGFQFEIYTNPTHRDALEVKYNTFTVYGLEVVKSIEINGGFADVAKLFIYMYNTNLSTNDMPVNQAKKYYKQDYALFTVLPTGKALMVITNTKYANNSDQFIKDFTNKKEIYKSESKIKELAEETIRLERENDLINSQIQFKKDSVLRREEDKKAMIELAKKEQSKTKTTINVYYFTKSNKKIDFKNKPIQDVEMLIAEKAKDLKKGTYSAYVTALKTQDEATYQITINATSKVF